VSDARERWTHQKFALAEAMRRMEAGAKRICVTTPTGGGKSLIICDLIEQAVARECKAVLYTNRRLLINQLERVLEGHGIRFGVRAAGHEDRRELDVQVSSLPTENARVFKSEKWDLHGNGKPILVIVDEAHLNKGEVAQKVLNRHVEDGSACIGFTATPIGLKGVYDELVIAGTPSELRQCGALVPAYHYGIDEPDMSNFRQNVKTGEFSEGDVRKAIMTKCIFGRVLEHYRALNPDGRPTILFAPGVKESVWFAQQLCEAGVRAAHIDGEGVWADGEYERGGDRERILRACMGGEVVLCNRFVAREGLDLKPVSHCILATVMGSLQSYLQSVGRVLRACQGKERASIQDHGGHFWRHGSVNADREWKLEYTENILSGMRAERFTEKKEPEPIRCPKCGLVRAAGPLCKGCGFESTKRTRMVMQQDGTLVEHEGDIFKPRRVKQFQNTEQIWIRCYYRAKNSKNRMTFRQAASLMNYEEHYWPPNNLRFMPKEALDWYNAVADVPVERLIGGKQEAG